MGMDGEQNIFLYNRHELLLSGIIDVCEFCEASVEMTIADGFVGVDGEDLKIDKFDSQTGNIRILGTVNAITYYCRGLTGKKSKKKKN